MTTSPPSFLEYPWRWQQRAGAWRLETDCATPRLLLSANYNGHLTTSEEGRRALRLIDPSDDVAKIIASAPEVRRHARALLHGIDLKLVHVASTKDALAGGRRSAIDHDKNLELILSGLREALEKSGAV